MPERCPQCRQVIVEPPLTIEELRQRDEIERMQMRLEDAPVVERERTVAA